MVRDRGTDIVFYARQLYNGGVDRVVFNLAEEFLKRGIAPTILVDMENPYSPFRSLVPEGVRYEVLNARGPIERFWRLRAYLRRTQPQAVMCTGFGFPNLYAIVTRWFAGVPFRLMLTEHCFPSVDRTDLKLWQSRFWFFQLAGFFYPLADSIVAVSRGTANDLAKVIGIDPAKVDCVYNPIVNDAMLARATEQVDHPWFAESDIPVIIAVGRLEGQKNFALLIRAFAKLRASTPARLLILGDGGQRDMLTQLVRDLGLEEHVALPGFVPNPHAFVQKASLFVLSSDFESLANVVVEAMAVGTPVIATDCPHGPAEALDHGRFGTLIPVGDMDRLSAAMLDVLRKRPEPVPPAWLDQFTSRHAADRYLQLLSVAA